MFPRDFGPFVFIERERMALSVTSNHQVSDEFKDSIFQDTYTVSRYIELEGKLQPIFRTWKKERRQNFRKVAGELYSQADLQKLANEQRPDFIYNYLVPFILKLGGAFKSGAKKLEVRPNTFGDDQLAAIASKVMDWVHYDSNDLESEHAKSYLDALIGRIGWLVQDWSYEEEPLGNVRIRRYDGDKLMFDPNFSQRDTSDMNYVLDTNWMTPEEIKLMYAREDESMWYEIDYWAKTILGEDTIKKNRLAMLAERVFGRTKEYLGLKSGFDRVNGPSTDYYDSNEGLFKVLEFHERRTELRWIIKSKKPTFDPMTGEPTFNEFDITEAIEATTDGNSFDNAKLQAVKTKYVNDNGGEYELEKKIVKQIYQTSVIPAFNMKVYDEPYAIQNGLFKYIPVFCFDFDIDPLLNRSYVDLMADPVSSLNLRRNTILTILMKHAKGGVYYEEGAIPEGSEDEFNSNTVGANKMVARGAVSGNKIKDIPMAQIPVGEMQYQQEDKASLRELTGLGNNATGLKESANESGKAVAERTANADEMQYWVQENALGQLKLVGRNTLSIVSKYMRMKRIIEIANEEDNPFWITINEAALNELTGEYYLKNDMSKVGEYRVTLATVPFGDRDKDKEFEETMIISKALAEIDPMLVSPHILVKASRSKYKREYLAHINQTLGRQDLLQQKMIAQESIENVKSEMQLMAQLEQQQLGMESQKMQNEGQKMNLDVNRLVQQASGIGA